MDASLFIERGNRLSAEVLAAAGVYRAIRHLRVHRAQHVLDQIAAIVHFSDDPVGLIMVISVYRLPRPAIRGQPARKVLQYITMTIRGHAGDDDARFV